VASVRRHRKRFASADVHLHARRAPTAEPVTIRAVDADTTGFAIPPPPPVRERSRPPGVKLDRARIETTLAETAAVAAVLADIFIDDEPTPRSPSADAATARTVGGVDGAHAALARALAQRRTWRRIDFEALARSLGLLPDGALEQINEAACARCGLPLCDGNDPLAVNPDAAQDLLA
jgi:hypothetical protein